jgi:hypothetical protein
MTDHVLEIYGSLEVLEKLRDALNDYLVNDEDSQPVLEILRDIDGYTLEEIKEDGEELH